MVCPSPKWSTVSGTYASQTPPGHLFHYTAQLERTIYRIAPGMPPPMPCNLGASFGYFSCTSNCVLVASAYESALTISPSVLESSAARSKYLRASVTLPCCRRSWAIVATAISHSGSTAQVSNPHSTYLEGQLTDQSFLTQFFRFLEILFPLKQG